MSPHVAARLLYGLSDGDFDPKARKEREDGHGAAVDAHLPVEEEAGRTMLRELAAVAAENAELHARICEACAGTTRWRTVAGPPARWSILARAAAIDQMPRPCVAAQSRLAAFFARARPSSRGTTDAARDGAALVAVVRDCGARNAAARPTRRSAGARRPWWRRAARGRRAGR